MKLLLDEMYAGLKEHLQVLGWEVETAQDAGLRCVEDKEVVEYAKRNGMLLVTQDQKSAELAELLRIPCLLISNATIAKMVDKEIRRKISHT